MSEYQHQHQHETAAPAKDPSTLERVAQATRARVDEWSSDRVVDPGDSHEKGEPFRFEARPGVLPRLAICPDLRIGGGEIAVQTGSGVRRSPSQGEAPNGTIAINGIQG